jgi:hypothetical protein
MIRRVLHPSDFSKASSAAFKKAVEMAKADRASAASRDGWPLARLVRS